MNIICIYSQEDSVSIEKPLASLAFIPFGISYIASALKAAGHAPRIVVFTPGTDIEKAVSDYLMPGEINLFCLTAVTSQYYQVCRIAEIIKILDNSAFIIIGGHHATLNSEEVISHHYFDAVCVGEGDRAIVEYAAQIESGHHPSDIHNLSIRKENGSIQINEIDRFIQDIDNLPFTDRKMWEEWIADTTRMPSILVGRGCPNKCSYCSNHAMARIAKGKYVRFRSAKNVVKEILEIKKQYPIITKIYLEVETLSINIKYAYELFDCLEYVNSKLLEPIAFGVNFSISKKIVNNITFVRKMRKANVTFINIGLESGSEKIRKEILRRPPYTNQELISFCTMIRQYGIDVQLFALIGIPGETYTDYKETLTCIRSCKPTHVFFSIYYPYPGTDLHRTAVGMNLISDEIIDPAMERRRPTMNLPGFSKLQIYIEYLKYPYAVYKSRKPIHQIAAIILRNFIGSVPLMNTIYRRISSSKVTRKLQRKLGTFSE